ncbi:MAG: hypothetical protein IPN42_08040 [Methylococcaceae bacterium]|nr:hypothetical protein [Methylococcaceae bacterium]
MTKKIFLSIGAMKAGTTWLYDKLKEHPDIHFSYEKELHYFANRFGVGNQLSTNKRQIKAEKNSFSLKEKTFNPRKSIRY